MKIRNALSLYRSILFCPPNTPETVLSRFGVLRRIAATILPEYRFKWPQMQWWQDTAFTAYLQRFGEETGCNSDRRYAVGQLLRMMPDGDTAEVGAYQGAMSWLICAAGRQKRMHHIFDSFEGLSQPVMDDGTHWTKGDLACDETTVRSNLAPFAGSFKTYKGWVPDRFHEVSGLQFAFVHIDVDLYEPTRDSISFFYPRMVPGGIIVVDDWGFTSCPGATKACDEFLSDKPERMIGLSAAAGFLIKGSRPSATAC